MDDARRQRAVDANRIQAHLPVRQAERGKARKNGGDGDPIARESGAVVTSFARARVLLDRRRSARAQ
jgi:hypothetical protein